MSAKKLIAAVLAVVMIISISAGCGKSTTGGGATSKKIKVGLSTDEGGLNDKSFNQSANEGINKAVKENSNIDYKAIESAKKDDYRPNLISLIDNGAGLIFGVGFQMADDLDAIAKKYPDKKFAIIDGVVNDTNVESLVFKEQEGSFLMGVIAAKVSTSNKIGFIGGKDSDLINKFAAGYIAGAKTIKPDIQIDVKYANSFADTNIGEEIAKTMYGGGCDIIYHAAGGVGIGVFKAAKDMTKPDKKLWAIGVDKDQALSVPEYADVILSSMVKRVDTATYETVKAYAAGKFQGGVTKTFGLKEDGVGIASTSNKNTPQDILTLVDQYKKAIIDGKIIVPVNKNDAANFRGSL
ncbi:MAG: BMP family ABC transporter substrate-binding protein [Bacillota bacterium]|nr:BMP family ABC transporter substrate-binding protein [Bacillota bacterium]